MLKIHPMDTLFEFIPEVETKILEDAVKAGKSGKELPPVFRLLFTQMTSTVRTQYRTSMQEALDTTQEIPRGKEARAFVKTKADYVKFRETDLRIARSLVRKATNFELPDGVKFVNPNGDPKGEWCVNKDQLEQLVEGLPEDWLSELVIKAQDVSSLTAAEKKS